MRTQALVATSAALAVLLLAVAPVSADSDYAGTPTSIDWRLVAIFIALALSAFYAVLELLTRGR
jgi:hypothetical protein